METIAKAYNKALLRIIDILDNELPNDPLIESVKRKYRLVVMSDKTLILTETGAELYKYREFIADDKWDELINTKWEDKVDNYDVGDNSEPIVKLIATLRKIWNTYDNTEKKKIQKTIKIMLSEYSKYLVLKSNT
jgi:hypothetical protein